MSVLICKMCGGNLEITEGMTTVRCPYCGTNQTLPKVGNEQRLRLYDRANHFRRSNDYDKAMAVYEQILNEDQTDSEAYWSIVLCRYGIEYVEDPMTHQRIPTVNRMQYTSVLADEDYKAALRYADAFQAGIYEQEAKTIDTIQRGILQVSQKEAPYDVFICCKEADEDGNRTKDSVLADELYYELTRNNYKVFWARITLQDKLGETYEPYIFAALNSAQVMVVIGTAPGNFQAVWVRNEWSRYLSLIKRGEKKVLIPAYRDMDPYDLPKEFSHLQALDMSRLGFVQDLVYSIKRISEKPKEHKSGGKSFAWKIGVTFGIVLVLILMFIDLKNTFQQWERAREQRTETVQSEELKKTEETAAVPDSNQRQNIPWADEKDKDAGFTGVLEQFVSGVYQCAANDVSDSQLAKIQQLVIDRNLGAWQIGYSFEAPIGAKTSTQNQEDQFQDELVWVTIPIEEKLDLSSLYRFTNLKRLDVDYVIAAKDIKGLHLESISAYFDNPAEAAEILDHPADIRELGFNAGADSLDGIELFENLETLYIDFSELDNIDALIHVKHLKNLTLGYSENLSDYAVLEKLSELETLFLVTEELKTLDFVSGLKQLNTLKIDGGKLRSLSGLENCTALKSLSIINCMDLKDMSAVSELINLQELVLDVPYGCSEPKLDRLTEIKKLSLEQVEDFSFLRNMPNLEELQLKGCNLPRGMDLSNLTSLKALSCTSYTTEPLDIDVIESFEMLESLNLQGSETYDDISGVFRMPNLKELNISGMQCEIDFDAITENSTLEILYMDDMYLYENVSVEYYSGIIIADWDEVVLDEHMEFIKKFPELKELSLRENGLTDLSFTEGLSALEVLDISDNYITQLRPLAKLPSLQKVICAGNPLKNEKVLNDSVLIIKEAESK